MVQHTKVRVGHMSRSIGRRVAASSKDQDKSAHPSAPNYDQNYANRVMGDIAGDVFKTFLDDYNARPPGLSMRVDPDGAQVITCDDQEAGVGVEVRISMLTPTPPAVAAPAPAPQPGMGIGPQITPSPAAQIPMPQPQPGMGIGPQ